MTASITKILAWIGPVAGAIKGHLNTIELIKVTFLASGGGLIGVLTAYQGDLGNILVSPNATGLAVASFVLTWVIDAARRLNHGTPAPAPKPAPAPVGPDNFPK